MIKLFLPKVFCTFYIVSFLENNVVEEDVFGETDKLALRQNTVPDTSRNSSFERFESGSLNPFPSVT